MYPEYTHFSVLPYSPLYPYVVLIPEKKKEGKRKKIYLVHFMLPIYSWEYGPVSIVQALKIMTLPLTSNAQKKPSALKNYTSAFIIHFL